MIVKHIAVYAVISVTCILWLIALYFGIRAFIYTFKQIHIMIKEESFVEWFFFGGIKLMQNKTYLQLWFLCALLALAGYLLFRYSGQLINLFNKI